jgi:hypothetical protein
VKSGCQLALNQSLCLLPLSFLKESQIHQSGSRTNYFSKRFNWRSVYQSC